MAQLVPLREKGVSDFRSTGRLRKFRYLRVLGKSQQIPPNSDIHVGQTSLWLQTESLVDAHSQGQSLVAIRVGEVVSFLCDLGRRSM